MPHSPIVTAVLGGSFNPIHTGHTMVASYISQWCEGVDEVWLSLSPMNPLKSESHTLISDEDRMAMLLTACRGSKIIRPTDVELSLPRPSYTIDTLRHLSSLYPERRFKWIIGSDNFDILHRWKDADTIISEYGLIVYPRPGYPLPHRLPAGVTSVEAPTADISSTWIREAIKHGHDVNYFLPSGVYEYIVKNKLYTTR